LLAQGVKVGSIAVGGTAGNVGVFTPGSGFRVGVPAGAVPCVAVGTNSGIGVGVANRPFPKLQASNPKQNPIHANFLFMSFSIHQP
jgi:hypothetical protein